MLTPPFMRAVRSLNFQHDHGIELRGIASSEWPSLLKLTDRSQLTLPLGIRRRDDLPLDIRCRVDRNLTDNEIRHERIFAEYRWVADALRRHSVDFVLLKGLSHIAPFYVSDGAHRPQYDIDIYCPPQYLVPAREAMLLAGYTPIQPEQKRTDHLPAMIRNRNWKWRGDYYDPDLPLTVELHFRFWDRQTERLAAPCVDQFWNRRIARQIRGIDVPTLSVTDSVSYSALHLMRHLLRGDLRVYHVYELAHFLHHTEQEHALWREWLEHRTGASPLLEAIAFRLAREWFDCKVHPLVDDALGNMPSAIDRWFELFAYSPLALDRPNKDELLLHLSLAGNTADRCAILARRMLPLKAPTLVAPGSVDERRSLRVLFGAAFHRGRFIARRAVHHVRVIIPLIRSAVRWTILRRKYAVS